jgi:peptidoglycan/LPS O-acetylase OafA/YrhL
LFVGGLLAIEYRRGTLDRYLSAAKFAAPLAAITLVGLMVYYNELDYIDRGTAMFGTIAITILGASAVVIGITAPQSALARILPSGFLRFFGRYSYAIYIVHTAVLAALDHYRPFGSLPLIGGSPAPAQFIWALTYVGVSIGLAVLSWHLVEKHFLRLKRFFPYGIRRAASGEKDLVLTLRPATD